MVFVDYKNDLIGLHTLGLVSAMEHNKEYMTTIESNLSNENYYELTSSSLPPMQILPPRLQQPCNLKKAIADNHFVVADNNPLGIFDCSDCFYNNHRRVG